MLPTGFKEKYQQLLGPQAEAFFASFEQPAFNGFRVNPLRPLAAHPSADPIPWSQWGYYGKVAGNSPAHVSGQVYSQEPSAQFVGTVAAPQPGERVLDLCAAPGGKTTQLGSYLATSGMIVANEINAGRAKVLASNVERFGLTNTVVTNADPATLAAHWVETFDRILVDAPCSGEGMFRKDPAAMQYWSPAYPAECAARQRQILRSAVTMLRPGGVLVYSTCTFAPEEDEQIAAWACAELGLILQPIAKVAGIADGVPAFANGDPALRNTARLWPQQVAGEGHFVAKFIKPGAPTGRAAKSKKARRQGTKASLTRDQQATFQAWWADTFTTPLPAGELHLVGDQLSLLPPLTPSLQGIRVVKPGLQLGTFKTHRFEASHSLATALPASAFRSVQPVTVADFARYRHGETLPAPQFTGKHTVLLTIDGAGFAVGKASGGQIKNAYPKGLRV